MSRLLWFVSTLVVAVNAQCFNTCPGVTFDHDCDDGGTGSEFALCALGTISLAAAATAISLATIFNIWIIWRHHFWIIWRHHLSTNCLRL